MKLIEYNKQHFTKVCKTVVYNDLLYSKLQEDEMRDAILQGTITKEDCQSKELYEFLKLLKVESPILETKQFQPIN